jgi:hypothetical protein
MRKKIVWLITFSIIIIMKVSSWAQVEPPPVDWGVHPMEYSQVGTAGWQFLKLPTNARTAAMGGILSALGYGDAMSALTNPAALADVTSLDVMFSYMDWVADIKFSTASVVKDLGIWGIIGVNFAFVDYGEMIRTENIEFYNAGGSSIGVFPVTEGLGLFSANDLAIGLSYARQITDKLQVGGNLRFLQERLDDATTNNWSLDIGTMYYTGFKSLRIAMVGKNFGPDAEFVSFEERIGIEPVRVKMPFYLALGGAMEIIEKQKDNNHRLTLAAEYALPNDSEEKINIGTEYAFSEMLFLRAGYRFNYDVEGLTLGAGLNYSMIGMRLKVDYAFLDFGLLNQVHMFTLGLSFNPEKHDSQKK